MSKEAFEESNWGWQLSQMQQRISEWWELQTAKTVDKLSWPSWLDLPIIGEILKLLFWIILALLLTWIAWQVFHVLRPYIYSLRQQINNLENSSTKTLTKDSTVASWIQRSQKFQQQGNYREACICLYMAMLQRLNDSGIIPHQSSRTDGEYLKLIRQLPQQRAYQILLTTHQELCFGNTEASTSVFEQCQQAYREIEQ